MRPGVRIGIIATAFAAVAALAVIGWARKPAPDLAYNAGAAFAGETNAAAQPYPPAGAPGTQAVDNGQQTGPYGYGSAVAQCAQPVGNEYETPSYANRYGVRMVRTRVIEAPPQTVYVEQRRGRRGRSTGRSIAIVAGSAGVGAAIGAVAGGGKGAAIGAMAGGGGGFVYDRLTHNR